MTAPHADRIIADYLKRLDAELSTLPRGRRREIRSEIEEHIAEARAALTEEETDTAVHEILDRLGEPEEIAAEANRRFGVSAAKAGPLEIAGLLLIGPCVLIVPFAGWLVGALIVWRSPCWTRRDKYIGVYGPLVAALAIALVSLLGGILTSLFGILIAGTLLPVMSAVYLAVRLGRRMPALAWSGIGLASVIFVLPFVVLYAVPPTVSGSVGPDESQVTASGGGQACGRFDGKVAYAGGLAGKTDMSVGLCWDGNHIRKTWGPGCFVTYGPLIRLTSSCTATSIVNGTLMNVSLTSTAHATTSTSGERMDGHSWMIGPEGNLVPDCTGNPCSLDVTPRPSAGRPSGR